MNEKNLLKAMEEIEDAYIREAKFPANRKHRNYKPFILAAAAVLCLTAAVPIGVAADVKPMYYALYAVNPSAAQMFKPVQMSCEDNGIRMEVISASVDGAKAEVYLSIQDLTENRIDDTVDLFDSYNIRTPYDVTGSCRLQEFDAETGTAYFLVSLENMQGEPMPRNKVTFSVGEFLSNKRKQEGEIPEISLQNVPVMPETMTDIPYCGMSGMYSLPDPETLTYLVPVEPLAEPAEGISVTGIGYVEGVLHVQLSYSDIFRTDNHGFVYLQNVDTGQKLEPDYTVDWDESREIRYIEYFFEIPYAELSGYTLAGDFVTADPAIEGDWEVTFSLGE